MIEPARHRSHAPVVIVGAGWSGLAAAVHLVRSGCAVTLIDSAASVGGRARGLELTLAGQRVLLDNGQHLLIGAYRDTLDLAREVGMATDALHRLPLRLVAVDGLRLAVSALPAPWHLLVGLARATGLSWSARWALTRQLGRLRAQQWVTSPATPTVLSWLQAGRQPADLIQRIWAPLCAATLNTAPDQACAATFARVLRDTLGAQRAASDFLLARHTLSEVLPDPALAYLTRPDARSRVLLRTTAHALSHDAQGASWCVHTSGGDLAAAAVILALPPFAQARLLGTLQADGTAPASIPGASPAFVPAGDDVPPQACDRDKAPRSARISDEVPPSRRDSTQPVSPAALIAQLARFRYEPIATVYLAWPADQTPALPAAIMLAEAPEDGAFGQWFFARASSADLRIGAVVVSVRGRLQEDPAALVAGIAGQVSRQLGLPAPLDARIVTEKRATFQCLPGRPRVTAASIDGQALPWPSLWLAGDHAWPDYPATLEGAVRSGLAAAQAALARLPDDRVGS